MQKNYHLSDWAAFDYSLPPSRIAQRPAHRRDAARLLDMQKITPMARRISSLPSLLREGDLLIFNNSRVLPARLYGYKDSGGQAEIFAERFLDNGAVLAQIRASRAPTAGSRLWAGGCFIVEDKTPQGFYRLQAVDKHGKPVNAKRRFIRLGLTPLPPYIKRAPTDDDIKRYQTIYARYLGSVAAPTAGLHFTPELLDDLRGRGIGMAHITLHVGAGTFMPLRRAPVSALHSEWYRISEATAARIRMTKKRGGRVVAVGTTALRALETAATDDGAQAGAGYTQLFIQPGFNFRVVDLLLTNFHLPRSSLMVLVCAFGGRTRVLDAYQQALARGFRFYSYGDAMLLSPKID